MNKTAFKIVVLVIIIVSWQKNARANPAVDTLNPFLEMVQVIRNMSDTNYLSFNAAFYLDKTFGAMISTDSMKGIYKIHGTNFYFQLDSTEYLQNEFTNIAVNHTDSVIIINRPKKVLPALIQAEILDSTFQSNFVSNIQVSDSLNKRKLKYLFRPSSPYSALELVYDTVYYNLTSIKCRYRTSIPVADSLGNYPPDTDYMEVRLVFSNYIRTSFSDTVFDVSKFVTQMNGVYSGKMPYDTFSIINQNF